MHKNSSKISRFSFLAGAALLALGCNKTEPAGDTAQTGEPAEPAAPKIVKLAFVTNNTAEFWKHAVAGIHKYEEEAKVEFDVRMPPAGTTASSRPPSRPAPGSTSGDAPGPAVGNFEADVAFHLAAQVDVRVSVARPAADLAVNVGCTLELAELCLERREHVQHHEPGRLLPGLGLHVAPELAAVDELAVLDRAVP